MSFANASTTYHALTRLSTRDHESHDNVSNDALCLQVDGVYNGLLENPLPLEVYIVIYFFSLEL